MTRDKSIIEELADRGISCRPSSHKWCKQLWRGAEFLGDFNARSACERFLGELA